MDFGLWTLDQSTSEFQVDFDTGGSFARRRAELLPDGAYLFEDELEVGATVTTTIITCAAWLLELYELHSEIGFNIHPVLLGSGIPLFHEMNRQINLELLDCKPFKNGCVYVSYRVKH